MSTYIAVTVRSPRKKAYWLGRMTLDGEVNLIAEFTTAHNLKVVVAKLNEVSLPEQKMDPQQPQHISEVLGDPLKPFPRHPDSVRAHNERWKTDGAVHPTPRPGEPPVDEGAVGGAE